MQTHRFQSRTRALSPHRSPAYVLAATVERNAKTEIRRLAGQTAAAEYEAARQAVAVNAERLRALRLARDAAQAEQARAKPKPRRRTK